MSERVTTPPRTRPAFRYYTRRVSALENMPFEDPVWDETALMLLAWTSLRDFDHGISPTVREFAELTGKPRSTAYKWLQIFKLRGLMDCLDSYRAARGGRLTKRGELLLDVKFPVEKGRLDLLPSPEDP